METEKNNTAENIDNKLADKMDTDMVMEKVESNNFLSVALHSIKIFLDRDMNVYSGNATLYLLMSTIPMLMLIIAVLNRLPSYSPEAFADQIADLLPGLPSVQVLIKETIMNVNTESSGLLLSVSMITALMSASGGVRAIQTGLDHLHGIETPLIRSTFATLVSTVGLVLLFPAMMIFQLMHNPLLSFGTRIMNLLGLGRMSAYFTDLMNYSGFITGVVLFVVILVIYTYLSDRRTTLKAQLPGALLTFVIAAVFTEIFSFFMGTFWSRSSVYGSLAAIFLIAMWTRSIVMILFYGAAVNNALEDRNKNKNIQENTAEEVHE